MAPCVCEELKPTHKPRALVSMKYVSPTETNPRSEKRSTFLGESSFALSILYPLPGLVSVAGSVKLHTESSLLNPQEQDVCICCLRINSFGRDCFGKDDWKRFQMTLESHTSDRELNAVLALVVASTSLTRALKAAFEKQQETFPCHSCRLVRPSLAGVCLAVPRFCVGGAKAVLFRTDFGATLEEFLVLFFFTAFFTSRLRTVGPPTDSHSAACSESLRLRVPSSCI